MKLIKYGNGKIAKVVYEYVKNKFDIICFTVRKPLILSMYSRILSTNGFSASILAASDAMKRSVLFANQLELRASIVFFK